MVCVQKGGVDQKSEDANGAPRESEDAVAAASASEGEGGDEKDEEESGGDAEEEAEEETEKPVIVLRTAPYDPRFPSTNQARRPPRFLAHVIDH